MLKQKSFFTYVAEMLDQYRTDRLQQPAKERSKPRFRLERWLPTPGNIIFTLLVVGLMIMTQGVWALPNLTAVPGASATTINYQGRLSDNGGNPLSGTYNLDFAIYDAPSDGNLIWGAESHPNIAVTDALFSVGLGSQTVGGIPTTTWDGDRYLEITVNGETLAPRELIRSVPIAGMALTVPDGAIGTGQIADGAVETAKIADGAVETVKIADDSVTLAKMGLVKYGFGTNGQTGGQDFINYRGTQLDVSGCSVGTWCCNAENTICYNPKSSGNSILEFSLEGAPSRVCTLLHVEDDTPNNSKGLHYATDGGNGCHMDNQCVRLSKDGVSGNPISNNAAYAWLCGW